MIRKISTVEQITFGYVLYFTLTLFFAPTLFMDEKTKLYQALMKLLPNQEAWIIVGASVAAIYCISGFIKYHWFTMITNAIGGCFLIMICVTYMFTYPNIGSGIFLFVSIKCFHQVFKESNKYEFEKTERLKKKMNTRCELHSYENRTDKEEK